MNPDQDRHLLFGLLALQTGLIDQRALVSAFHAWTRDKGRSLAQILADQGAIDAPRRALLDGLVAEHLKVHGGEVEKSLAAVPVGPSTRDSLAAMADPETNATIQNLTPGSFATEAEAEADRTSTYGVGSVTSDGRRFRVLRPHARGGLGAVFVALDGELHREVALKQMLDSHADDPISRRRFLIEAEITGGLEHPGIVPVYGLGTYDGGRPYYAMRFVRGDSLKEAIERSRKDESRKTDAGERSLELRKLLGRFLDVCNAIEYAHARGVLHRDIKPSNIVVGTHGETLVVDWGLAKARGRAEAERADGERTLVPSSSSGSAETLPGAALGTPSYMSPEQARGDLDALGPASDVYSLGATLYYVLTGRPAFEGDVAQVLRAVQAGDFPPPRKHDPSIDPALESICLKAMALRPQDRYPGARALAEDLERWMADEPVSSWREPVRRRLARWQTRHPAIVYGGVATLAVTVAGVSAAALAIASERDAADRARVEAVRKTGEADRAFQEAANATYFFMNRLADQRLAREPGLLPLRKELTDEAVRRFDQFLAHRPDDPTLIGQAARAHRDASLVRALWGTFAGPARRCCTGSPCRRRSRRSRGPRCSDTRWSIPGTTRRGSSRTSAATPRPPRCSPAPGRGSTRSSPAGSRSARRRGPRSCPRSARCRAASASGRRTWRGGAENSRGRASYLVAVGSLTATIRSGRDVWFWYHLYLAQAHRGLALVAQEEGRGDDADREFAEAVRICREQVAARRDEPDPPYVLAITLGLDAGRKAGPARAEEIEREFAEAMKTLDATVSHNPARLEASMDRAEILAQRGRYRAAIGRDEPAEADLDEARKSFWKLLDGAYGENLQLPGLIGRVELALARVWIRQGRADDARDLLNSAIASLERAGRERPGIVDERKALEEARAALRQLSPSSKPGPSR